jgi:hypothetical protein
MNTLLYDDFVLDVLAVMLAETCEVRRRRGVVLSLSICSPAEGPLLRSSSTVRSQHTSFR